MLGSAILEVAIGLVFVYLLLSLICSAFKELISGLFALRAKTLEKGIQNLFHDLKGVGLAKSLYDHPLIKGLAWQGGGWLGLKRSKPSYIPSPIFALALIDTVMDDVAPVASAGPRSLKEVRDAVAHSTDEKMDEKMRRAVLVLMDAAGGDLQEEVRNTVAKLPDGEVKKELLTLMEEAAGGLKKARENLERWFDDAMDRVSGWYKRTAQWIILSIALVVSALTNADTLTMANSLWRDGTMRAAIVAAAQEVAQHPTDAEKGKRPREATGNLPGESTPEATSVSEEEIIDRLQREVQKLPLPLGWSRAPDDLRRVPQGFRGWLAKIVGLLLTAIAVSLGAPFWFDLLNKLVSLRAAGKPPGKTSEGKSEKKAE